MYVSVKREEKSTLTKLATKRFNKASRSKPLQVKTKERQFSNTLQKRKELGDNKANESIKSRLRQNKSKVDKSREVKNGFKANKSHLDQKVKSVKHKGKKTVDNENTKTVRDQFNRAKHENSNELNKIKDSSKQNNDTKTEEKLKDDLNVKNNPEKMISIMMMLNEFILNLQKDADQSKDINLERASALITEISNSEEGLSLLNSDKKIDLAEIMSLEDFAKLFNKSESDLKETQDIINHIKEFSKEILSGFEKNSDIGENKLADLMAKLNVVSSEIKNNSGEPISEKNISLRLKPDVINGNLEQENLEKNQDSSNQNSSNQESKEPELKSYISSYKTSSKSQAKLDGEFFQSKLSNLDAKQELEKINLNIQKNLKSSMKTQVFDQIKNHIAKQSIKGDRSEMVIKLKPEELGKVELKIEVHKDQVIAKMNVASQMVKEAIEANLSDLKSSLKDKGFDVTSFDVNLSDNSSNSETRKQSRRDGRSSLRINVEESLEGVSDMYMKSLEGLQQGSTFEELA